MSSTAEHLGEILARDYGLASAQLTPEAPLAALGIDSLSTVELLWTVETAFGIALPPKAPPLRTFGEVVSFVDELVARQRPRLAAAMP